MKRVATYIGSCLFTSILIMGPFLVHAGTFSLIPCNNKSTIVKDASGQDKIVFQDPCDINAFVTLIRNVINAIIVLSIPAVVIALTWVGILLLTAQGNVGRIEEAKRIAKTVMIGFAFILAAWLIVHSITNVLFKDEFNYYLR